MPTVTGVGKLLIARSLGLPVAQDSPIQFAGSLWQAASLMMQAFVGCALQRGRGRVCTASQVHVEDSAYGTTPGLTYGCVCACMMVKYKH